MGEKWLSKGTLLKNRYEIRRKLAISELSIVYLGYDRQNRHPCVIKEFFPKRLALRDLDGKTVCCKSVTCEEKYKEKRSGFLNEAVILKRLRHENIVGYLDDFIENHTGYIITAYCKGKTLDEYIEAETAIAIGGFLRNIFLPLLSAIKMMHKMGVIHRDIKPSNIIVDFRNKPVLIDFGSAIHFKEKGTKEIFVTPGFSPLELYSKTARQGQYSDIYSLAATLYYYLCGKAPKTAAERIIEDNIEDIRQFNRFITPMLSRVIMKSLALDSKKRFSSLNRLAIYIYLEWVILKLKKAG